jgi:hypothetical protein
MPKYGTSETEVFTSTGRLKLLGETEEECQTCDNAAGGPHFFNIIRDTPTSVELICPNCGTQKTVFPNEVKRKPTPQEAARRAALIAAATAPVARPTVPSPVPAPKKAVAPKRKPVQKKPAKKARPAGKRAAKKGRKLGRK